MSWKSIKEKLKFIDPYTYMDYFIAFLHKKGIKSKVFDFILQLLFSLILAYLTICLIGLLTGAEKPITIVVTGSMQPNVNIGDMLLVASPDGIDTKEIYIDENIAGRKISEYLDPVFIDGKTKKVRYNDEDYFLDTNADVVVYHSPIVNKDLVHRAVLRIKANDGIFYLTKGDNQETNFMLDQDCDFEYNGYLVTDACFYETAIPEDKLMGKMVFRIPYIGYVKVLPYKAFLWLRALFV